MGRESSIGGGTCRGDVWPGDRPRSESGLGVEGYPTGSNVLLGGDRSAGPRYLPTDRERGIAPDQRPPLPSQGTNIALNVCGHLSKQASAGRSIPDPARLEEEKRQDHAEEGAEHSTRENKYASFGPAAAGRYLRNLQDTYHRSAVPLLNSHPLAIALHGHQ